MFWFSPPFGTVNCVLGWSTCDNRACALSELLISRFGSHYLNLVLFHMPPGTKLMELRMRIYWTNEIVHYIAPPYYFCYLCFVFLFAYLLFFSPKQRFLFAISRSVLPEALVSLRASSPYAYCQKQWRCAELFCHFLFLEYNIFPPAMFLHRTNLKKI